MSLLLLFLPIVVSVFCSPFSLCPMFSALVTLYFCNTCQALTVCFFTSHAQFRPSIIMSSHSMCITIVHCLQLLVRIPQGVRAVRHDAAGQISSHLHTGGQLPSPHLETVWCSVPCKYTAAILCPNVHLALDNLFYILKYSTENIYLVASPYHRYSCGFYMNNSKTLATCIINLHLLGWCRDCLNEFFKNICVNSKKVVHELGVEYWISNIWTWKVCTTICLLRLGGRR